MTQSTQQPSRPRSDERALRRWERWTAHCGYIAEGVLYLLVGFFALVAAVGRQQPNGAKGALAKLGGTVAGDALLAMLAAGLAAFVLWQLILAIADPEHRTEHANPRRRVVRLGHLLNGVFHCVFVGDAMWSMLGLSRADDERASQVKWTAWMFALPVGRYVVGLVGAGIVIFGLWQFYRALSGDHNRRVELGRARFRLPVRALGIYGLLARGILFLLVGGYLVNAAWRHDPRYSGGIAGALAGLKQQPYGAWLLGTVASGLLCYGLYQITKEPYRNLGNS
ncbi:MAG TPA: DUF1206 domain-containing protein [Steroidobacteraceae bacterium]|jgi:hypothetical protein|nr:DUF1206 domain-containing protein [Steroidobacteraceae bacterium]